MVKSVVDVDEWVESGGDLGARADQSLRVLWEEIVILLEVRILNDDGGDASNSGCVDEKNAEWEDEEQDEGSCGNELCANFVWIRGGWISRKEIEVVEVTESEIWRGLC